jgi:hypothetical protein
MKKSLIALAALTVVAAAMDPRRARTHDISYGYRMPAGFPGAVNRTHPASVYPVMLDQTAGQVPASYGVALVYNAGNNTVRQLKAADQSDSTPLAVAGLLVRPWPVQGGSSAGAFGQQALTDATAPVTTVPNDMLTSGRMLVQVNGAGAAGLNIDSDVYVWCAASAGSHVLGGFEPAASAGNTVKIANAKYRGPGDANNVAEIEVFPSVS